jgi:hypothetical protein
MQGPGGIWSHGKAKVGRPFDNEITGTSSLPAGRRLGNWDLADYFSIARDSLKISGSAPELAFARWGSRFGCFSERFL